MSNLKHNLSQILFWSVLAAAFIGPGTLATASASGANHGLKLIWTLVFSTVSCIIFQEMAARISIVSGNDLISALKTRRLSKLTLFIGLSVILGCAAYEAGNILGALSGIQLIFNISAFWGTLGIGVISFVLLWYGSVNTVARLLGFLVAAMTVLFISAAISSDVATNNLLSGAFIPTIPDGSELLVLGLIGTTIVPYNLFLGSGLGKGQKLSDMRFGLIISITLGGIISIAIVIVGTQLSEFSSFGNLATYMLKEKGKVAFTLLALGLFSAGLTSAITAPLAAAIIGKSLFSENTHSSSKDKYYRLTWIAVLILGLSFGIAQVKPLPIIILAQALNGLVLPAVAMLILILANDDQLMTNRTLNTKWLNIFSCLILNAILLIGMNNIFKATVAALNLTVSIDDLFRFLIIQLLALPFLGYTVFKIISQHRVKEELQ